MENNATYFRNGVATFIAPLAGWKTSGFWKWDLMEGVGTRGGRGQLVSCSLRYTAYGSHGDGLDWKKQKPYGEHSSSGEL